MAIDFPSSPTTGQSYTDSSTGQTWIYNGTGWASSYNRSSVVRQSFTASAGQTTFTVSGGYAPGLLDVYQNGVKLVSGADYTASNGTTVVLVAGASAGDSIEVWGLALFAVANMPTLSQFYSRAGDAGPVVMRNRIINGGMRIDQRYAGAAVANASDYVVDRFRLTNSGNGRFTAQQVTLAPAGFTNSLQVTVTTTATPAAADYYQIVQAIEGFNFADMAFGAAGASAVTVSFWARASIAGTYAFALANGASDRVYVATYTINNANTWEFETITIPGDVAGTWLTNNGIGAYVIWDLGCGSNFNTTAGSWQAGAFRRTSSCVNLVATNGATFAITGVQLEAGGTATPFERRNHQQELAMCQRYFEKSWNIDVAVGSTDPAGKFEQSGGSDAASNQICTIPFKVTKRANPTVTGYRQSTGASGQWDYGRSGAGGAATFNVAYIGNNSFGGYVNVGAVWAVSSIQGHWTASAEL